MRRYFAGVGAVLVAIALTGCVSEGTQNPGPSVGTYPQSVRSANTTPAPLPEPTVVEAPEADSEAQNSAIGAAAATVTAFARPDLSYTDWINGLYPHMSQTGALAYEDTDPSRIPAHQVTGPGEVMPASTDVALIVRVPTDAGAYDVSLSRTGEGAPWLADRIRPAQG